MSLNQSQKERYLRNIVIKEIGEKGQEKLLSSKVLVVGAGGLGSTILLYLAAAGIGNLGIIDFDVIDVSNLQRQIIHNSTDLGNKKTNSAKEKINKLNDDVNVNIYNFDIRNKEHFLKESKNYDFIIDATDNFSSRFTINEVCYKIKKPLIFAAVKEFSGQLSVFKSYQNDNPCYQCLNPSILKSNLTLPINEKGIIGPVAGALGCMQAIAIIKEIIEIGESLVGKLAIFDFLSNNFRLTKLKKDPHCLLCSSKE